MSQNKRLWTRRADARVLALLAVTALASPVLAGGDEPGLATANLAGLGAIEVTAILDPAASPPSARLVIETDDGAVKQALAPLEGAGEYVFYQMTDVAFTDLDGDGVVDLLAVAQFVTGIGPTGADPFPLATVYLRRGEMFERSAALEAKLNNPPDYDKWTNVADAVSILKAH